MGHVLAIHVNDYGQGTLYSVHTRVVGYLWWVADRISSMECQLQ